MKAMAWVQVAIGTAVAIVGCNSKALCADVETIRTTVINTTEPRTGKVTHEFQDIANQGRAKIAVALGGGGCKGVANIGVLRALEAAHVHIDCIIGTSCGATVGALYAAGMPLNEIEKLFIDGTIQKAMVPKTIQNIVLLPAEKLSDVVRPRKYGGLTDGSRFEALLSKHLPTTFNNTKIPFYAVVTDLSNGQSSLLHEGNLPRAVHASNSLPPVFQPVEFDGKLCVDGGLQANLPADVLQQTGSDVLISVLVYTPVEQEPFKKYKSLKAIMGRTEHIMLGAIDQRRASESTIVIKPNTAGTALMTTKKDVIEKTIKSGEEAGALAIPAVAKIQESVDRRSATTATPQ